jgi:uncharacterized Fe-S radical SAM superfamily protein PflX
MNQSTIQGMLTETERRTCLVKHAHMSLRDAEDECERMIRKTGHQTLIAYRCVFCQLWHVGHPKTPQRLKAEMMIAKMN